MRKSLPHAAARASALAAVAALALLAAPSSAASRISVTGVWSRPAVGTGVVYASIRNTASIPDALLSASSPVARAAELHESMSMPGVSGSMNGMPAVEMRPLSEIRIPAGGSVQLRPGGYHIMLIGLHHDLQAGEAIPVTLHFRHAGTIAAVSHVRPMLP